MKIFEEFIDKFPPALAQQAKKDIAAGESPITVIERIKGNMPPKAELPRNPKKERVARVPPPEQGSLF
jgi:hypothetical protein